MTTYQRYPTVSQTTLQPVVILGSFLALFLLFQPFQLANPGTAHQLQMELYTEVEEPVVWRLSTLQVMLRTSSCLKFANSPSVAFL